MNPIKDFARKIPVILALISVNFLLVYLNSEPTFDKAIIVSVFQMIALFMNWVDTVVVEKLGWNDDE
jgi:hypothetical protein